MKIDWIASKIGYKLEDSLMKKVEEDVGDELIWFTGIGFTSTSKWSSNRLLIK